MATGQRGGRRPVIKTLCPEHIGRYVAGESFTAMVEEMVKPKAALA